MNKKTYVISQNITRDDTGEFIARIWALNYFKVVIAVNGRSMADMAVSTARRTGQFRGDSADFLYDGFCAKFGIPDGVPIRVHPEVIELTPEIREQVKKDHEAVGLSTLIMDEEEARVHILSVALEEAFKTIEEGDDDEEQ